MAVQMEKGIPLSALNPKFLHSNSTSHTWPFSAVAELIDNAYDPDVKAKQFWIDKTLIKDQICLTFVDNGGGMDYDKMYKMLSFGFSDKKTINGHAPVGLYGNGFKSGSMRLGKDTIVFSKNGDSMCVGMLSQTYLEDIKAENIIVPIVAFRCTRQSIQPESQHTASLQAILHYSLFQTEKELLAELNAINSHSGSTGTRIIIWNLRKTKAEISEFDFDVDRYDIQIPADVYEKEKYKQPCRALQSSPESDFSLRAYCSILYLKPRMQIIIRGQKVKTELISKSLAHINKDKYKPVFLNKETIPITFGYNTKSKEHYGVMMYHKNRLIKAYERVGCQNKANDKGVGVIAVIECNFLKPTHNKQDFDYTEEYRKTLLTLGVKLEEYWRAICFKKGPNSTVPVEDMPKRPDQNWVQCDECLKWRKLPDCIDPSKLPEKWFCLQNPDPQYRRCDVPEEAEDSEDEAAADLKIFKQHERNLRQQEKQQEQKRFEGLPTLTAAVTASSPLNFRLRSQAASSPSESLPVISDVMSLSTPKRLKRNLKSLTPNQAVKKVRTANACSSNTLNSPSTSTATPNVLSMVIPKNCDDDVIIVEINSTPKPKKLDFDLSKVKPERRTSDDVPGLHMECSDHASIETPVTEDTRTTTPTSTSSITQTESNIALKVEEDKQKQKEGKGEDRDNGPITMEQSGISVKRRIDKEMEINRLIEEPMEYMTCRSIDGENRPALTEDERMSSIPVKNYVFKSQERTDSGEKSSQRYPDSNANLDKGDKEGTSAASKSSNFHSLAHIPTTEAQQQQDNLMDLLDSTARERDEWREHAMLLSLKLEKQNIKLMELTVKREHSDQSAQTDPSDELDYKTLYLQATQQIEELRRERDGLKTNEEKMLQMKAEKEAHDKMCSDRMKAPGEGTSEIINAHESVDDEMALQLDFLLREMDQRNQLCGELKEKLESLEEERNGLLRQLKQIQKDMEQLRKETEEQRKTLGEQGTQTDFQCVNQVQVRQSSTQTSSTEDGTTSQASLVNQEDDASERREENSAIPAKLRELRVSVARLLVTFVPALDLEQVNYDCDVIDEILDQVLREISPPLTISN